MKRSRHSNKEMKIQKEEPDKIPPIAGGFDAEPNSWPWMVREFLLFQLCYLNYLNFYQALLGRKHPRWNFFCGGVLINKNFILTAAHCLLTRYIYTINKQKRKHKILIIIFFKSWVTFLFDWVKTITRIKTFSVYLLPILKKRTEFFILNIHHKKDITI